MARYQDLVVWQKAMLLVEETYTITKYFPATEQYALANQMQRAAVSIPSNIAEGSRRATKKDTAHFLTIAFASGAELETQIEISRRLQYVTEIQVSNADRLLDEVMRMLNAMIYKKDTH